MLRDFNEWPGTMPHRHKVVVPGNHDFLLEERQGLCTEEKRSCFQACCPLERRNPCGTFTRYAESSDRERQTKECIFTLGNHFNGIATYESA